MMRAKVVLLTVLTFSLLLIANSALAIPSIPSDVFQSTEGCGCHSSFVNMWSESMHAKAISDPIYQYELELALRATDGALGPFCNSCHAPIASMAGEIDGLNTDNVSPQGIEAISCDFCHQVTGAAEPLGNSAYLLDSPDGTKRASLQDAVSPAHATAYSEFHETGEFCGMCHDVYHPVNGLPLEQTYTEWKNGPYAAEGVQCQDCHMTPGPGVTKPNPGTAAAFGPEREHVNIMTFAGGNVGLGASALAEERLQAAAEITIETPEFVEPGTTASYTVSVANVGAGHYLPTGITELRKMWLEVVGTDEEGTELFSERHDYGLELADEAGNSPVQLWEAASIAKDDRIPPKQQVSYDYTMEMPESGVVDVVATLYYRSVSEEIAEKSGVEIPTTLMTQSDVTVYGSEEFAADVARSELDAGNTGQPAGINVLWFIVVPALLVVFAVIAYAIFRGRSKSA
jgi:hypothetical protein